MSDPSACPQAQRRLAYPAVGVLYVTTKYFNPGEDHGHAAFGASLDRLGRDHIDLYLIHWPVRAAEGFVESWRALTELRGDAGLRSIGVSNFSSTQLAQVIDATGRYPLAPADRGGRAAVRRLTG